MCFKCGEELSRSHAEMCGNVKLQLMEKFPDEMREWGKLGVRLPEDHLPINFTLNKWINQPRSEKRMEMLHILASIISKLKMETAGYYKDERGFWKKSPSTMQFSQNPGITEARRRQALRRNRPIGRPRGIT